MEAMPAQIPTDLCIGTCRHLPEQLREWRIFAILARGAAGAKSVEQWVRKKAFNASKDGRRDIFTCGYSWSA